MPCYLHGGEYYAPGSRVEIKGIVNFGRGTAWSGDVDPGTGLTRTVVMDRDRSVTGTMWPWQCRELPTPTAAPGGIGPVSVRVVSGDNPCPDGFAATGALLEFTLDQHVDGQAGWVVRGQKSEGTSAKFRVDEFGVPATAYVCVPLATPADIIGRDGKVARLWPDEAQTMVEPAPNCPFSDELWLRGQEVRLGAFAPPDKYAFRGWSGAATGSDAATTVVPSDDLANPSVARATYDVVCHRLKSNYDEPVTVRPAPNCPGAPASEHWYLHDTVVVMYADENGDDHMYGWEGDFETDDNPVAVVMDRDHAVYYDYRARSTTEKVGDSSPGLRRRRSGSCRQPSPSSSARASSASSGQRSAV